jgi:phage gpG-like protein
MFEAFPDGSVIFGSNMVYARIHQQGGQAGRGKKSFIPARPYMGVPKDFDRRILNDPEVLKLLGLEA